MKNVDKLITRARERTKNSDFDYTESSDTYTSGVSSEVFIDAINDAQDHLQAKLAAAASNLFVKHESIDVVADQQAYSTTSRLFGNIGLISVQYNHNANSTDYGIPLQQGQPRDIRTFEGYPRYYIPKRDGFRVIPIPESATGSFYVSYYEELDDLDIRRGTINGTPATTDIVLAASPAPHQGKIEDSDYICVSDKDGNVMLRNGVFSSYAGTTITLAANVSTYLVTGYTLADLDGGFITCGKYTTNMSKLPDLCERYLRLYMQKRILTVDESNTSIEEDKELLKIEADILENYNDESRDVEEFPILDHDILL